MVTDTDLDLVVNFEMDPVVTDIGFDLFAASIVEVVLLENDYFVAKFVNLAMDLD